MATKMTEKHPRSAVKAKAKTKKDIDFDYDQPARTASTATRVKAVKGPNFTTPNQGSAPTPASTLNAGQAMGSNDLAGSYDKGGIRFDTGMKRYQHEGVEHTSKDR